MKDKIILDKGKSIKFLDYTIKNSLNNDGLVLMKEGKKANAYECHLGNFGQGTQDDVDTCKRYAIIYFMVARPEEFATQIVNKTMKLNSGCMHEFYALKRVCKDEGIELPSEITDGDGLNAMIYFKGKPLADKKDEIEKEIKKSANKFFDAVSHLKDIKMDIDYDIMAGILNVAEVAIYTRQSSQIAMALGLLQNIGKNNNF